jgi:hypothetical protein
MENNARSVPTPWEKLLRLLEPDPEEVAALPIEEVEERLAAAGIDPEPVVASVEYLVHEALARWGQDASKEEVESREAVFSPAEKPGSNVPIRIGEDFDVLRSTLSQATSVAAEAPSYVFDDRHIRWRKMGDFEHFEVAMLDVDVSQNIVDFLIKFEPNQQIFLHRHTALTNTLVVQGEHRLYEPNGALKEVRRVGTYTSSPPGEPHNESGGVDGGVVLYRIRGEENTLFEVLDDTLKVVGTLSTQDFMSALKEQKSV